MIEFIAGTVAGIYVYKRFPNLTKWLPKIPKYYNIVKFGDQYALRRGYFKGGYTYKDLRSSQGYWWLTTISYFKNCLGDLETVKLARDGLIEEVVDV